MVAYTRAPRRLSGGFVNGTKVEAKALGATFRTHPPAPRGATDIVRYRLRMERLGHGRVDELISSVAVLKKIKSFEGLQTQPSPLALEKAKPTRNASTRNESQDEKHI